MSNFYQELTLSGNKLLDAVYDYITSPDPLPASPLFGHTIYWDGTGIYPTLTEGQGLYWYDGTNWNKIIGYNSVDTNASSDTIVLRDSNANFSVPNTPTLANHAISLDYLNTTLASGVRIVGQITQTGPSHYPKGINTNFVGGIQTGNGTSPGSIIAVGNAWRIATGGFLMGQPSGRVVESGDIVIAITYNAGNNDNDWIVIQNNIQAATTTIQGSVIIATSGEVANRTIANATTTDVMTPELTNLVWDNFTGTTTETGTVQMSAVADVATRAAAALVSNKVITPEVTLSAFDNFLATASDLGTFMFAMNSDFANKVVASGNVGDGTSPNLMVQAFNNFLATNSDLGTVILAQNSDTATLTTLQANTTDVMTPALVKNTFDVVNATSVLYGTVRKYINSNITSVTNALAEDNRYMTPNSVYQLLNNLGILISARINITGTGGLVTFNNVQVADIVFLQVFDSTGAEIYIGFNYISNSGPNVDISWSSSPSSITGHINILYIPQ